jgi:hypothetical protein
MGPALACPECGSRVMSLVYRATVHVDVRDGSRVARVVVDDESASFTGEVYCSSPECSFHSELDREPHTTVWPAWELGF